MILCPMRLKRLFLSVSLLMPVFSGFFAQDKVMDVWSGSIPGATGHPATGQIIDTTGGWVKLKNVSVPTLEMYLPAKDKANGTAVIICPGGAYAMLAIIHEGKDVARWLNSLGITAFVLNYRLPDDKIMTDKSIAALQDAQEAIRLVRRSAQKWHLNPAKIGIMGFSAGGHVASALCVHYQDKLYASKDTTSARPDFSLLIYPVITMDSLATNTWSRFNLLGAHPAPSLVKYFSNELHVTGNTPPAFIVQSMDDDAVPVVNSIDYALALHRKNVPCELHVYQSGGHGYGMGRSGNTESTWPEACAKWLKMNNLLSPL